MYMVSCEKKGFQKYIESKDNKCKERKVNVYRPLTKWYILLCVPVRTYIKWSGRMKKKIRTKTLTERTACLCVHRKDFMITFWHGPGKQHICNGFRPSLSISISLPFTLTIHAHNVCNTVLWSRYSGRLPKKNKFYMRNIKHNTYNLHIITTHSRWL